MKCWQQSLLCEVTFEFDGKPMTRHFLHKMPRPVQKSSSHRSDQTNENPLQLADTRTPRMRDSILGHLKFNVESESAKKGYLYI